MREFEGRGHVLRGPCPIHGGSNPKQFTVNIRQQSWFPHLDGRILARARRRQGQRFALHHAAFGSVALDRAFPARAIVTAIQMNISPPLATYSEIVRLN